MFVTGTSGWSATRCGYCHKDWLQLLPVPGLYASSSSSSSGERDICAAKLLVILGVTCEHDDGIHTTARLPAIHSAIQGVSSFHDIICTSVQCCSLYHTASISCAGAKACCCPCMASCSNDAVSHHGSRSSSSYAGPLTTILVLMACAAW